MILKADAKTVNGFVTNNFIVLTELYRAQQRDELIPEAAFVEITRHQGDSIVRRLREYKLMQPVGDDYRLVGPVAEYIGFLLNDFKPLLPEQLGRYRASIQLMFDRLLTETTLDADLRTVCLEHLYQEVQAFLDNVSNNTFALLRKSHELKINRKHTPYAERMRLARDLVTLYITPLTAITDLNNDQSIASLLQRIAGRINQDRLLPHWPERVQKRYQLLHELLRQVNARLVKEGATITRELVPLLEQVRRESETLGGFIYFLEEPLLRPVPEAPHRHKHQVFGTQTAADLRMYVEQFLRTRALPPIDLSLTDATAEIPFADRQQLAERLRADLPVADFFAWCDSVLEETPPDFRFSRFFSLFNLLFAEENDLALEFTPERRDLPVGAQVVNVPHLSVSRIPPQP